MEQTQQQEETELVLTALAMIARESTQVQMGEFEGKLVFLNARKAEEIH